MRKTRRRSASLGVRPLGARARANASYGSISTKEEPARPRKASPPSALHPGLCDLLEECKAVAKRLWSSRLAWVSPFRITHPSAASWIQQPSNYHLYGANLMFGLWLTLPRPRDFVTSSWSPRRGIVPPNYICGSSAHQSPPGARFNLHAI